MLELDLIAEADRQFTACNACRYCEGFCAVFPAAEVRTTFAAGDIAYLANLCHDCRMCFDACPFTPPHEFAVNIPELLATARVATYEHYTAPRPFARLFRAPVQATSTIAVVALALVFAVAIGTIGLTAFLSAQTGAGAFYRIFSFAAMVTAALVITVLGIIVVTLGALRFARDIELPKMTWSMFARATHEALSLVYMRGGGAGCYDVRRGSQSRRVMHALVFWGFLAAFASTISASVEQDLFGIIPPFPYASVPVVLGAVGGVGILVGCVGLIVVKRASDPEPLSRRMVALDSTFLVVLALVALTGLLLLAFRSTAAMPALLAVHLGLLAALYLTAPYGKFIHFVYRYLALLKHAAEDARPQG